MSHDIHIINGQAQMAYLEQDGLPWHGLGQPLKVGESLDEWRVAAGLDWEAERQGLFTFDADGNMYKLERDVLVHSKTKGELGYVTDVYKTVQPADILDAFRHIAGEAGYHLVTAGNLRYGRRIWALADCDDDFTIGKKDQVKRNLLLATSYDGSLATIVDLTSTRVVCQNTLAAAIGYDGEGGMLRYGHSSEFDPTSIAADLKTHLAEQDKQWQQFKEKALALSNRKVDMKTAVEYFVKLFGNPDENGEVDIESRNTQRKLNNVIELYQGGLGQELAGETAWGLVNTVTRWADHERNTRTEGSRLDSAFFGDGRDKKAQAWNAALELLAA